MHAAKGLEFPIVFIHGGMGSYASRDYLEYYSDDGEKVYDLTASDEAKAKAKAYWEAELARLLYVGVTRAIFRVYLIYIENEAPRMKMYPCLSRSLGKIIREDTPLFSVVDAHAFGRAASSAAPSPLCEESTTPLFRPPPHEPLPARLRLSFSSLAARREKDAHIPPGGSQGDDFSEKYDEPLEDEEEALSPENGGYICLARGAKSGLAVHTLLEDMDFERASSDKRYLRELIARVVKNAGLAAPVSWLKRRMLLSSAHDAESAMRREINAYLENLTQGLLDARLACISSDPPFSLSKLSVQDSLKELVFDESNPFYTHDPLENTLVGVIDLVFRHAGKYYIIDWKTNWLHNYNKEALQREMEKHEYFLQAALYADAFRRWLESRHIPSSDFGGALYVFVRACTSGEFCERESGQDTEVCESGIQQGVFFMDRAFLSAAAKRYRIGAGR
jgi:exodeoxyribonuclease V beta subunit